MGIKGLGKFLSEQAPGSVRQMDVGALMGRMIAVDASMSLYQFMIAIRDGEGYGVLTNEAGEATSHITGFLSRVVKLLEHGIKPVYVFDGKPVELKSGELKKRSEKREKAAVELEKAKELGDQDEIKKFMGRTVRITKEHNEDVKELLRLLGVPVIDAPTEAEAQCAQMARDGLVFATATEDADALTFGSPVLIRNLSFTKQKAKTGTPIVQITLQNILSELDFGMDQFIDFCILCGCDYTDRIKGIGPAMAYKLVKQNGSIEKVLEKLDKSQYSVPENYCFKEAREFFQNPDVEKCEALPKLVWRDPNESELRRFLIDRHSFNPSRVDGYLNRIRQARSQSSQTRLEAFFGQAIEKPKNPVAKSKAMAKEKSTVQRNKRQLASTNKADAKKRKNQ